MLVEGSNDVCRCLLWMPYGLRRGWSRQPHVAYCRCSVDIAKHHAARAERKEQPREEARLIRRHGSDQPPHRSMDKQMVRASMLVSPWISARSRPPDLQAFSGWLQAPVAAAASVSLSAASWAALHAHRTVGGESYVFGWLIAHTGSLRPRLYHGRAPLPPYTT